jgi:YidC/Oxa1 family membrane protein insertase
MPEQVSLRTAGPVVWAAAKNKFFVQILESEGSSDCRLYARRDTSAKRGLVISTVRASVLFPEKVIPPGGSAAYTANYFVGPKKYAALKELGQHQDDVMQFGVFRPICKVLLVTLNGIHRVLPNYGVAIVVLTVLVRIIFWPITHKSTESMKKMQKIQPLVTQVREKYKDKPQKMNQEVMALYKQHKVNPMAGCLPMLVQIPVFIALFTVLRSAVELRYAGFLWIKDLSEPEGLLAGMLPLVGSLNILPLFMTGLTVAQQRLTPAAGDPQQQKMMMLMPLFFLFIFYNMPSALVLYWSTSQGIAVIQLVLQRRKVSKGEEDDTAAAAEKPSKGRKSSRTKK